MGPERTRNSLLEAAVPRRDRFASREVGESESSGDFQKRVILVERSFNSLRHWGVEIWKFP